MFSIYESLNDELYSPDVTIAISYIAAGNEKTIRTKMILYQAAGTLTIGSIHLFGSHCEGSLELFL